MNADAGLANPQRQLDGAEAVLETAQAQVSEAQAVQKKDADDAERYQLLVVKDEIPRQRVVACSVYRLDSDPRRRWVDCPIRN